MVIDEHDAPRRRDLAAMIVPLGRALMAAELPVLRAHDISMWGYAVLLALGEHPTRTQAALAAAIGADKTRVIPVLDELQDRGLIERRPDPADRRARLLSVTPSGKRLRESVQRDIQRREERLLSRLAPGDRAAFLRALQRLAALPPAEIRQGEDLDAPQQASCSDVTGSGRSGRSARPERDAHRAQRACAVARSACWRRA